MGSSHMGVDRPEELMRTAWLVTGDHQSHGPRCVQVSLIIHLLILKMFLRHRQIALERGSGGSSSSNFGAL